MGDRINPNNMSDKPFMVKQTITFSDGTETVINYRDNAEYRKETEVSVSEAIEGHNIEIDE